MRTTTFTVIVAGFDPTAVLDLVRHASDTAVVGPGPGQAEPTSRLGGVVYGTVAYREAGFPAEVLLVGVLHSPTTDSVAMSGADANGLVVLADVGDPDSWLVARRLRDANRGTRPVVVASCGPAVRRDEVVAWRERLLNGDEPLPRYERSKPNTTRAVLARVFPWERA